MRLRTLAVGLFLALAACGPVGQPSAATSPSTSSPSSQTPNARDTELFAIATGLPGGQLVNSNPPPGHATVKIVDGTGRVYAEASFVPPPAPLIGNAEPLLQSPVRTAVGAVFYADSNGAVHMLKADGSTSVVATFPLTNTQQALSYAGSPAAAPLIATIFSAPPVHTPPPQSLADPFFQDGGHWTLKLEIADAGGSTSTTLQRDLGTALTAGPTEIVGWDLNGPLATLTTQIGTQQAPPSAHLFGTLIHLAPDGTHLDAIGGPSCTVVDEPPDGTVVCDQDWQQFSVRTAVGQTLWQATLPSDNYYYGLWLSPDATAVAVQGIVVTRTSVTSAGRQKHNGQSQLIALGWRDANTVVEAAPSGELSLYDAHGLTKIRDLGLSGLFEGRL